VYRGHYKHEAVAIKEFLTASQAERPEDTAHRVLEDEEIISQGEALFLFRSV